MFNKTIRSVLSLALAFCLLLGMSGNAIAMTVENPASGIIDQVDKEVNQIITDLEEKIADLEKEVEKQEKKLNDAKQKLDEGEARLPDDKALLNDKRDQLEDAKLKLADANVRLQNAKDTLAGYEDQLAVLEAELKVLPEGAPGRDDKLAEVAAKQAEVAAKTKEVEDAIYYIGELTDFVGQCDEKIAEYEDKIPQIEQDIADAKEILPKAETAVKEAKEAVADAKTVVENIKSTYADLYEAVTAPEVSLTYVKQTLSDLYNQTQDVWADVLDLQESLHELEAAYAELEGFKIEAITISKFVFEGFKVEEVIIDGQTFAAKEVKAFTIDGFQFSGFTAPTVDELASISDKLDDVIARIITLNAALDAFVAAAKKVVDVAQENIDLVYAVKNNLNKEGLKKVYNWLYNNPDKVCAAVKEYGVYGLDLLVEYGPYAMELLENHSDLAILAMKLTAGGVYLTVTLGAKVLGYAGDHLEFLEEYKGKVIDAARKLYAKYGDEAKALVEVYVDYLGLRERYYNATHADYTIFHDSLYVAIGDSTAAVSGSYVEKLAEMMGIPHMTENLGQFDMTVADAIGMVGQNAELIGKADLITLGFSNIPASFEVMNALVADYDNDFTNIVTKSVDKVIYEVKEHMAAIGFSQDKIALVDRAGEVVDNGLTALNNRLIAEGLDEATINMVMQATEAYAVTYLSRAVWYPCLVNAVQDVNPDAQIVIVGTYNDLDGVVLEVSGRNVNIGEYVKYLVAAANLENLVQAFFEDGVIYVNAHNVETVFEENAYEGLNNLGYLQAMFNDEMLPSEAGATYIAEQIFDALDIEYKILGDVNGDHKVNCRDARLLLLYAAELVTEDEIDLTWADVNGDGRVNTRDARLVLLYCVELIEHFPACNLS